MKIVIDSSVSLSASAAAPVKTTAKERALAKLVAQQRDLQNQLQAVKAKIVKAKAAIQEAKGEAGASKIKVPVATPADKRKYATHKGINNKDSAAGYAHKALMKANPEYANAHVMLEKAFEKEGVIPNELNPLSKVNMRILRTETKKYNK